MRDREKWGHAHWSGAQLPLYPALLGPLTLVRRQGNTCLIRPDGRVACWGRNNGQALGATDRTESKDAVLVKVPPDALRTAQP